MMFCAEFGCVSRSGASKMMFCAEFGCYFPLEMRKMMFPRGIWGDAWGLGGIFVNFAGCLMEIYRVC